MGTRSLTVVADKDGSEYMVLYRQYDGYPEGMGRDIVEKFGEFEIVNGFSPNGDNGKHANGLACLAGQIVAHFKQGIGQFYLEKPNTRGYCEEYIYYIYPNFMDKLCIRVTDVDAGVVLYDGLLAMYHP